MNTASDSDIFSLSGATIFTGEAFIKDHEILIQNGVILAIAPRGAFNGVTQRIDLADKILSPGFIDCQVNGGGDLMLNNSPTTETALAIAAAHRNRGTTGLVLTCISDTQSIMAKALSAVREARKQDASILGIHFEGPHISLEKRGCHKAEHLRPISSFEMELYSPAPDETMIVTVASECVTIEQIRQLRSRGIIVSLGHSKASSEQVYAALDAGATCFTHLYNAMEKTIATSTVSGCALYSDKSWCSVIADGHHITDEMLNAAIKLKPEDKLFLISDGMAPSGSKSPKSFDLFGEKITVKDGKCVNGENKLAGSAITMSDAVYYCANHAKINPIRTLNMASAYPAAFLGLDEKLGKLAPGYTANIIALNQDFTVSKVFNHSTFHK
ncbi:MAG: N-acetylglucosamine-6-phosphate deacetylase [Alphaproteobacteria bacterium]|nr:N-acetylglucosamine-6-phosphate deacetylase [Alphaproteobacteria bacterium]